MSKFLIGDKASLHGQSMIELALAMPLVLLIIVGLLNVKTILESINRGEIISHHQILQYLSLQDLPETLETERSGNTQLRVEFVGNEDPGELNFRFSETYQYGDGTDSEEINFLDDKQLENQIKNEFQEMESERQ